MDRTQWPLAPYTEADLQSQIDDAPKLYGADGRAVVDDVHDYVDGHQRLHRRARARPDELPAEYAALGTGAAAWKPTDVDRDRVADRRHLRQGRRREVRSAQVLQALEQRFGTARRRDARGRTSARSTTPRPDDRARSASRTRPASPFSTRGLALPDPGSVKHAPPVARARARPPAPPRAASPTSARSSLRCCAGCIRTRRTGCSSPPGIRRPATRSR